MGVMCSLVVAAGLSVSSLPSSSEYSVAHSLLFRTSLKQFVAESASPLRDARLNWNTDGCSAPLVHSTGRSFDFYSACHRHDFGYRNMPHINGGKHWTLSMRRRIDSLFRTDMRTDCAQRPRITRAACRAWAETFYRAVRARTQLSTKELSLHQ
jgi:hypothetical protein